MTDTNEIDTQTKLDLIVESIKEKKGKQITRIDLTKIHNSICDHFVICHGTSTTQVDAIADAVQAKLKKEAGILAHHVEGATNSRWILVDYYDVLVHIFLDEVRTFYKLEELWADGEIDVVEEEH